MLASVPFASARHELKERKTMSAVGTELVCRELRVGDVAHDLHALEPDASSRRETEIRRVTRSEVDHAEVAQRQLEIFEQAKDVVGVYTVQKMLLLVRIAAALRARRNLSHLKRAEA
ncbi:MAG: hypothetical protein ACREON_07885 [Gemmatimonadaceae bacterium]